LLRLVARTLVDNAIDGDTTAARECFDRMDGKVTQGVDATGQVRGDITVTWVRPAYWWSWNVEALFSPQLRRQLPLVILRLLGLIWLLRLRGCSEFFLKLLPSSIEIGCGISSEACTSRDV
jgi:hypothetical protein